MRSNAVLLVIGFRCQCLLPKKEEKSEEAWEPVFSFGHFLIKAWWSVVWLLNCFEVSEKAGKSQEMFWVLMSGNPAV